MNNLPWATCEQNFCASHKRTIKFCLQVPQGKMIVRNSVLKCGQVVRKL